MPLFLNNVSIAGNLTRDPEVRFVGNNTAVCNLGVAINRRFKDSSGEQREETTFVDVEAWGRTAEICGQYLTKGRNVYIDGSLKLDQWQDKEGKNQSKLRVRAQNVQFIGGGGNREDGDGGGGGGSYQKTAPRANESAPASTPAANPGFDGGLDDEPPF